MRQNEERNLLDRTFALDPIRLQLLSTWLSDVIALAELTAIGPEARFCSCDHNAGCCLGRLNGGVPKFSSARPPSQPPLARHNNTRAPSLQANPGLDTSFHLDY